MKIGIDYETYYDKECSVSELGTANYAAESDAYIVSVVSEDLSMKWCGAPSRMLAELGDGWLLDPKNEVWAANAGFDRAFFEKYHPQFSLKWCCALDAGRVNQVSGNLAGITSVLNGRTMSKSLRDSMKGVTYESLTAEEQANLRAYCLNDSLEMMAAIPKLPMSAIEERTARQTREINRRGVCIDTDLLARFIETAEQARMANLKRLPWRHDMPALSPFALPRYCLAVLGVVCPKSRDKRSREFDEFLAANPPIALLVKWMRAYDHANKLLEKLRAIERRLKEDGHMPLEMIYCGAPHTRRWTCRGVNVQNLDRAPTIYDSDWNEIEGGNGELFEKLSYIWLRHLIIAPPGKKLAALDYAQIEPRVLAWLVGDEEMLAAVRAGFGVYDAYARAHMGWKGGLLKKENPLLYQNVKNNFLGGGYGLGWKKLKEVAHGVGVELSDEEALGVITNFRADNPRTVNFWGHFDTVVKQAILHPTNKTLEIEMPTGEYLRHYEVRPHRTESGRTTIKSQTLRHPENNNMCYSLWGGLLTENVTQRMARDLIAGAMVEIEDSGAAIINFSAHDEAVLWVDDEKGLKEAERIMRKTPAWCEGLPLDVEGGILPRYCKM